MQCTHCVLRARKNSGELSPSTGSEVGVNSNNNHQGVIGSPSVAVLRARYPPERATVGAKNYQIEGQIAGEKGRANIIIIIVMIIIIISNNIEEMRMQLSNRFAHPRWRGALHRSHMLERIRIRHAVGKI